MLHAASKRKVENDDEFTAKAKLQAASRGRGHADEECQHTLSRNTKLKASSKSVTEGTRRPDQGEGEGKKGGITFMHLLCLKEMI